MRVAFIITLLLLLSAFFIISNENIKLDDSEQMHVFGEIYYNWASGVFDNLGIIIGEVVKTNWFPGDSDKELYFNNSAR